jgi:hypothetical protein
LQGEHPAGVAFFPAHADDDWEDVFKPSVVARKAIAQLPLPPPLVSSADFRALVTPAHTLATSNRAPLAVYFTRTPCLECAKVRFLHV